MPGIDDAPVAAADDLGAVQAAVAKVIVGKAEVVRHVLVAALAGATPYSKTSREWARPCWPGP